MYKRQATLTQSDADLLLLNLEGTHSNGVTLADVSDNDTVNAAGSTQGIFVFGGVGSDTINTGSGEDIIISDRGVIEYLNAEVAIVDLLEDVLGFVKERRDSGQVIASIRSVDVEVGMGDFVNSGAGNDIVIGGSFDDSIEALGGDNILIGDNGTINYLSTDSDSTTLDEVTTQDDYYGGVDTIITGTGNDILIGSSLNDVLTSSGGNNIVLGDRGYIRYLNGFLDEISSTFLDEGLGDTITTGDGDDIVIAGIGNNTPVSYTHLTLPTTSRV